MDWLLKRVWERLLFVIGRGRIQLVDDTGNVQMIQIVFGPLQNLNKVPRIGEYGFSSNPPEQSDCIVVCIAGDPGKGVVVGTNSQQFRMRNLQLGESALHDNRGQHVYLSANGIVVEGSNLPITVNSTASVAVNAPQVKVTASTVVILDTPLVKTTGDILDNSGTNTVTLAQLRNGFRSHHHDVANVQPGTATITSAGPNPTV